MKDNDDNNHNWYRPCAIPMKLIVNCIIIVRLQEFILLSTLRFDEPAFNTNNLNMFQTIVLTIYRAANSPMSFFLTFGKREFQSLQLISVNETKEEFFPLYITINETELKIVQQFSYLGCIITSTNLIDE